MPSNQQNNNTFSGSKKKLRRFNQTAVYQPSIYRYTCRGAFYASSEQTGSRGSCRGLRSRVELLSDMELNTREGALKDFTYLTEYDIDDQDAELSQQTKSILVSPALVYKELDEIGKEQGKALIPEEEIIRRQEWRCYGSTEVEYLVLKNPKTGQEKISAVAPRNTGLSIRKIESDDNTVTSYSIGWLNLVVDAGVVSDRNDKKAGRDTSDNVLPEEVPPKPAPDAIQTAKEAALRTKEFTGKVAEQMKANVEFLYENIQDDFAKRTYHAGEKIVEEIPKTMERTVKFVNKMFRQFVLDDSRDNDRK